MKEGTGWIKRCAENEQFVMNTWFKYYPRRMNTWISPGDRTQNQTDYRTTDRRFINENQQAIINPGTDKDKNGEIEKKSST